MKRYIEIKRTQTVRIPIMESATWIEARNILRTEQLFDVDNILDFDKEVVVDEDYSGYNQKYKIVDENQIKAQID